MDILGRASAKSFFALCFFALFSCTALPANALVVEPANNSIFILLDGLGSASDGLDGFGCKALEETDAFGRSGVAHELKQLVSEANVYYRPYLNPSLSPVELAKEFAERGRAKVDTKCKHYKRVGSIMDDAVEHWFDVNLQKVSSGTFETENFLYQWMVSWKKSKGKNPTLEDLKLARPDLIPASFVVIADGMGGMVAREYIQSANYKGEIANVLFFDTPHEGSGFADQALLAKNSNYEVTRKGKESLSAAIPLVLAAYVLGGDESLLRVLTNFLKQIVLGLAEDLGGDVGASQKDVFDKFSINDAALWYLTQDADLRDGKYSGAIANSASNAKALLGSTQYLNEAGKATSFEHPNYNIVFSSGLPAIGNGRRTFPDFKEQNKYHVSNEKLVQVLTDSLKRAAKKTLNEQELNGIKEYAKNVVDGVSGDNIKQIGELFENADNLKNLTQGYLKDFEDLRSLSLNINDLPETTRKILRILDKYVPDEYKSELMSSIINEYSPKYGGLVSSVGKYVSKGMALSASNLANYGLNLYDQGRFDVPSYSAYGGAVGIFKETRVNRQEYSLENVKNDSLKYLKDLYEEVGKLEFAREVTDIGLDAACRTLEESKVWAAYGKICRAAEFATNVALIADISTKTSRIAKNTGKLLASRNASLAASVTTRKTLKEQNRFAEYSDLEGMLFSNPHISLKTVDFSGITVPLMLYHGTGGAVGSYEELKNVFGDSTGKMYPFAITNKNLVNANMKIPAGAEALTMQVVEGDSVMRNALKCLPAIVTTDFVREMHFNVEDFSPAEMWYVTIDFNAEIQFAFERVSNGWTVKAKRLGNWSEAHSLNASPIRADGLFIFNLEETLKLCGINDLKLSAIEREGPNLVTVHTMNKIGKLGNQQFSFFFQSTTPYMQEGFPQSLQYVNALDSVYIHLSNLGNPYKVKSAKAYLLNASDTLYAKAVKIVEVENAARDTAWEQKWNLYSALPEVKTNAKLKDGMYTLLWKVTTEALAEGSEIKYELRTNVYIDKTAPQIVFDLPNSNLKNTAEDGFWGSVVNKDSSKYFALQSIRSYLKSGNEVFEIANEKNYGGTEVRLNWNSYENRLPNGKALLFAEAMDYAGNVKTICDTVWIDNVAPQVALNSVKFTAAKNTADTVKINAESLLQLEFDIEENLFGRSSEKIQVELYFDDVDGSRSKLFVCDTVTNGKLHFVFNEPEMQKLFDGVYHVGVVVLDEAKNRSSKKLLKQILVVDRTLPVVGAFMLSAPVYTSFKDLEAGIAYLSQVHDHVRNRSELDCKWKLVGEKSTPWQNAGIEKNSAAGRENAPFAVRFSGLDSLPNGRYVAHFGCFDAAGNFGSNVDVISVGYRHPEITYPLSTMDSTITYENLAISGIAPDPILPGGNEATATFKIEWRKDSVWSENGITYLQKVVDPYNRKLAVWNRSKLSKGDYEVRLTVCNQAKGDTICTSDVQRVYLNNISKKSQMKLVLETPKESQVAGDSTKISIHLDGDGDTLDWRLDARIEVTSPSNKNSKALAARYVKERTDVSPFTGAIEEFKDGLSVFQNADGHWMVHWQGRAEGIDKDVAPRLLLKFKNQATEFIGKVEGKKDSSVVMDVITVGELVVPGFDASYSFDLKNFEKGLDLELVTDSAFTVDISSVAHADSITYCGKNSKPKYEAIPRLANSKMLFVNPEEYKTSFYWDGLTMGGLYPDKGYATLFVTATSNQQSGMAIMDSVSWLLNFAPVSVVSNMKNQGSFVISRGSDSSEVITLGNGTFGYEFGIKNQKARVSAYVLNDSLEKIKTLIRDEDYVAGKSLDSYSLSWDGTTDNGFVATTAGKYFINVIAIDEDGHKDSLLYPFNLQYAGSLLPAPIKLTSTLEYPAELIMEEAYTDASGNLRYVGRADYELDAKVSAMYLPDSEKVFRYTWDFDTSSYQTPAVYEADRFSIGIRRKREAFEVAVVTLVATTGYDIYPLVEVGNAIFGLLTGDLKKAVENSCDEYNKSYVYTMRLSKMKFHETMGAERLNASLMDQNFDIVAKDNKAKYPIHFAVKVFPITDYEKIRQTMGNVDSLKGYFKIEDAKDNGFTNVKDLFHTDGLGEALKNWNDDFGATKFWSFETQNFYAEAYDKNLRRSIQDAGHCEVDMNNPDKFVCGGERPKDSDITDFNPHADMFTLNVFSKNVEDLKSNDHGDCTNSGYKNLPVYAFLTVNYEYWNPEFGYNNLANRFTRFDHSNKVLYGPGGYFSKFPKDASVYWNYHDGIDYKIDENYGLVTPFETQRFIMLDLEENPLLFADELTLGLKEKSKYTVNFFGTCDKKNFKASIIRYGIGSTITCADNKPFQDSIFHYDPMEFYVWVSQVAKVTDAIKNDSIHLPYPYKATVKDTSITNACEELKLRDLDKCNKYYVGASRLHYGLNDWNDSQWFETFVNPDSTMKNLHSTNVPLNALNVPFTSGSDDRKNVYEVQVANNPTELMWSVGQYQMKHAKIVESPLSKSEYKIRLFPVSLQKNWKVERNENNSYSIWNKGVKLSDSIQYVRLLDSAQRNNVADKQYVLLPNIKEQNPGNRIFENQWIKNITFSGIKILDRDTKQPHQYFTADTLNQGSGIKVERNGNIPMSREKEIVSLKGRVPGNNVPWTLSYMKNGKILSLESGIQKSASSLYNFAPLNVNTLQGNTSFFLTYGGSDGNMFFKQLDVHIGEYVSRHDTVAVQSMYGDAKVQFMPESYDSDVDVTVRTIGKDDYNLEFLKNLDPVGTIVEVLPSHVFPDTSSKWPRVQVRIPKENLTGKDPSEVKIYKIDFASNKLVPLEQIEKVFLNDKELDVGIKGNWTHVLVSGLTRTFSTFAAFNSSYADSVNALNEIDVVEHFGCDKISTESIWMGTENGFLDYPNPCSGSGVYLLQLRSGRDVVLEYQGMLGDDIHVEVRKENLQVQDPYFGSRLALFSKDGKLEQLIGPTVFVDSVAPSIEDFSVKTLEAGANRRIEVNASLDDVGSGIKNVVLDLYYAGQLIESRRIDSAQVIAEDFDISRKVLNACPGCKASVTLTVFDHGHNFTKQKIEVENMYSFPSSLVLWYPLQEGSGTIAHEMMNSGMDLALERLERPWSYGKGLFLYSTGDRAVSSKPMNGMNEVPFSIEFTIRPSAMSKNEEYSIVGFDGNLPWLFGIAKNRRYFFEYNGRGVTFDLSPETSVNTHIVLSISGNKIMLYRNGVFKEAKTLPVNIAWNMDGNVILGKFKGLQSARAILTDLRIYKDALTASQIHTLYNNSIDVDEEYVYTVAARAVNLQRDGVALDLSCEVPGAAFVKQGAKTSGKITWNPEAPAGKYSVYVYARGLIGASAGVELFVDGVSHGSYAIPSSGKWETVLLEGLEVNLNSESAIAFRPLSGTGLAGVALADIPVSTVSFGEEFWEMPNPSVEVQMQYVSPEDKAMAKPTFKIKNLTSEKIVNAKLRYYYRGEGPNVVAESFYPSLPMSIVHDAGSVYYAELALKEPIEAGGYAYYGNGPQIGLHRSDYSDWYLEDDPSFENGAVLLDSIGNVLNSWNCFAGDAPAEIEKKQVQVVAKDLKHPSNQGSNLNIVVENTGTEPLEGFEVRYYLRDTSKVQLDTYYVPGATYSLRNAGGDLWYVSLVYDDVILNPGEKTGFGQGANFELHYPDWHAGFESGDDPSHYGVTAEFSVADSIVVLDKHGNLLHGGVPQPKFGNMPSVGKDSDVIYRDGENLYVNIETAGFYELNVVNAIGIQVLNLFKGSWDVGEHMVTMPTQNLQPGNYLVLSNGSEVISWTLLK